jgi:hypothetical protein
MNKIGDLWIDFAKVSLCLPEYKGKDGKLYKLGFMLDGFPVAINTEDHDVNLVELLEAWEEYNE